MEIPLKAEALDKLAEAALEEDLGPGDLTTNALVPGDATGKASIRAKADGVVAGQFVAEAVYRKLGVEYEIVASDGSRVEPGMVVGRARGKIRSLLEGERAALNFLARLSGVATLASRFVTAVEGTKARILDTRKTTPLYRALEKYAVRAGGATNHRMGLGDQVLVKENHVAGARAAGEAGRFSAAVKLLMERVPDGTVIGIEVTDLSELHIALEVEPAYVLCDNFGTDDLRLAVQIRDGWPGPHQTEIEASGGVTLENVAEVAATGVDRISVGALTHSAPALDLSMTVLSE